MTSSTTAHDALAAGVYCPRLVREWVDEDPSPERLHRRVDGSMVFADVSGFTKMSERLARFGKVGAESVTDVIGACFTRLLEEAYAYGGTLVQFGGDALLLFYQGDGHAHRAAAAALAMRSALRSLRGFQTEAGTVRLSMTVGVQSGGFDFFLVGGSHRQLIVGGAVASELVRLEGEADKGRILISDATAASLDRANVGPRRGPGHLLRGTVAWPRQPGPVFLDVSVDMSDFVAVGLRRAVASGAVQSEHRSATVAFVHFTGLDRAIEEHGPDEAGRRLDALVRGVQASIDHRGICLQSADIGVDGGKLYLSVGAPLSTGHDEEQMLLALHEVVQLDTGLPVRAGVNAGAVFTGEIGTVHRRTYTTMGDPVNLAARVMAKAQPGQLLATQPVLDRSRTLFATTALPPFTVKGKRLPVTALDVGAPIGTRTPILSAALPLVGRDEEVAAFREAVAAAAGGSGRLVEVVAEPGVGKSRLLEQFVADAGPLRVQRAACRLYQAATPYFVVTELLGELFGLAAQPPDEAVARLRELVLAADPELEPWLALVAVPFGLDVAPSDAVLALDDAFRKDQLHASVTGFLASAVTEPVLLCFEDAQWMDEASGELLDAIAVELERLPWVVVLTRRDVETGYVPTARPPDARLVLGPLDPAASRRLAEAAAAGLPLAPHVRAALVERSDGNPLFLLELVEAIASGGDLDALPTSVEGVIVARIDRLDAVDRAMLRHLSVLGAGFRAEYVPSVAPAGTTATVAESLERLVDFIAVDDTGWASFRHALVRDAAYGGLPFRARRELHGRIADSIVARAGDDAPAEAPLLSVHCLEAHRHEDAWRWSVLAGDQARDVYANLDAATSYGRAIRAAHHLPGLDAPTEARILERLGDVQDLAGLVDDARRSYAAARRLLRGDPVAQAALHLKTAFIEERLGLLTGAIRNIRRGQRLVDGVDDGSEADGVDRHGGGDGDGFDALTVRARLAVWYAVVRIDQGLLDDAATAAELGARLAERAGDEATLAQAFVTGDYANAGLGRDDGDLASRRALEISTRLGDLRGEAAAANMLGAAAYHAGRWDDAADLYRRSRRAARERMGDAANAAVATVNLAELLVERGLGAEADADLRDAEAIWSSTGDEAGLAFSRRLRGVASARAGDVGLAAELLTSARAAFDAMGARGEVAGTDVCLAELALLEGDPVRALAVLDGLLAADAVALGGHHLLPAIHRLRGAALAADGREATAELEEALRVAREHGAEHEVALALHELAEADRRAARPVPPERDEEEAAIVARLGLGRRLAATPPGEA